jgi:hypothetical protein
VKTITKFVAFDDTEFETEAHCRAHEFTNAHKLLVGLSLETVERALVGDQDDVAEAIEVVGAKLARARRERGDLKRRRAPKDTLIDPEHRALVTGFAPDPVQVNDTTAGTPTPPWSATSGVALVPDYARGQFNNGQEA